MFTAVLAGLGKIGAANDFNNSSSPRSHLGAILNTPELEVTGLIDPEKEAVNHVKKKWSNLANIDAFPNLDDYSGPQPDVIIIAGPAETRMQDVKAAIAIKPRVILIEKPIALNLADATIIAQMVKKTDIHFLVNFHRRFDPKHTAFFKGLSGTPNQILMRYNKGTLNYAPHLLDMLMHWYGEIEGVQSLSPISNLNMSMLCRMKAGFDAVLIGINDVNYDQFEADFYFKDGVYSLLNGGCERIKQEVIHDLYYPGYDQLGPRDLIMENSIVSGFAETYMAISRFLTDGTPTNGCNAMTALVGLKAIDTCMMSAKNNQQYICL